ncbi:hypothetical protein GHK29_04900 [Sinorhizobium medicae]|uniref:hypothetical protein n=1 Tax=Sinorhizobium medicae TaxID=110321 RepID=UPI001297CA01|nr:hypothetical protein [Sinorhizobium medicae]MDX2388075.1 hypothetical protein [Sinorhizobium medicae]MQU74056.1 hypothetical protein [Sinorhizobium medicae]
MKALIAAADRVREFRLHPLVFFYLQDSVGEGRAQRVHVWLPGGPDRPENDRHQHSFDIESLVAAGRMRSELFSFEEEEGGPEVEFAVTYDGKASILSPSGRRGRLLPIASFETITGATYRLEAGVIHRVSVTERPCITLVQTQERHIPIFSYGNEDEAAFDRRLCTEIEAERIRCLLVDTAGR